MENVRSVRSFTMEFDRDKEAGWHVVLGSNGAGKSSVVRSFALLCMGEKEAYASRQDFLRWLRVGEDMARVSGTFTIDRDFDSFGSGGKPPQKAINAYLNITRDEWDDDLAEITYGGERHTRTIYGGGAGWFSASFGPFRRFTGGDRVYDRLFFSNKRLASHLSALGEDVALTEAMGWLSSLHVQNLQDEKSERNSKSGELLSHVIRFFNESGFLPHGTEISVITNSSVLVKDGNANLISIDLLSDGYRSALSFVIELVRQMCEIYGIDTMLRSFDTATGAIMAPGVVAVDEVDAHLHPTWQHEIGRWLTKFFPKIQFIVTTHSPIVCRAVLNGEGQIAGSVWQLPAPGSNDEARRVSGDELDQLLYGDVLDAFGTNLFGRHITRSAAGKSLILELAALNQKARRGGLTAEDKTRQMSLKLRFPEAASESE